MKKEWLVPFAVLLANAISVLISLLVPFILAPNQYATFSLVWASGQFMTGVLFEWLRLAALRYSSPGVSGSEDRKEVLVNSYLYLSLGLVVLVVLSWLFSPRASWLIYAGSVLFSIGQGIFDGNQAFTRAARQNVSFARNWIIRAVLSLSFVVITAWLVKSGWWTAIALGFSLAAALVAGLLLDGWPFRQRRRLSLRWSEWPRLARYGLLAAVSGIVANALPTVVRWGLVAHFGKEGAAGALLAADLSQKALSVTGLAVNVVAMQNSFSAVDSGDAATIHRANQKQVAWAFAAVVPIGLVIYLLGDDIARLLMRDAYRPAFVAGIASCAFASALICVRLYAIDPLFYAFERAGYSAIGSVVSLGLCLLGLELPYAQTIGLDPLTVFWGSAAAGLLISVVVALAKLRIRLPWSQLGRIAVAAGAVALASALLPHGHGIVGFILIGGALGMTYVFVALLLNIVHLRTEILAPALRLSRAKR